LAKAKTGTTRIGVGGWTYEPWRGTFYPKGHPQKQELHYASRQLTSIEVNGTFYGAQKPESFAKWHDDAPEDFVFSLKAPRYATNRKVLAEAGASIERFLTGGLTELKQKLGPINWQFATTKIFDPVDFEAFLKLLPAEVDGHALRHVVEVRHQSFQVPEFIALARAYKVAIVLAADSQHPLIPDATAPFVYARLMGTQQGEALGYPDEALDQWVDRARIWASGSTPDDLAPISADKPAKGGRDVYLYVISGNKVANPAAAMSLIGRMT